MQLTQAICACLDPKDIVGFLVHLGQCPYPWSIVLRVDPSLNDEEIGCYYVPLIFLNPQDVKVMKPLTVHVYCELKLY